MAVRFVDGFDHYSASSEDTTTMLKKWTGYVTANPVGYTCLTDSSQARSLGGQCLQISNQNATLYKTCVPNEATVIIGAAIRWSSAPITSSQSGYLLVTDGASEQVSLRGDGAGHLQICRGTPGGGGAILAVSTNTITLGVWYYVEMKVTVDSSAGVIELRVNGSNTGWIPSTGSLNTQQTANSYANGVGFTAVTGGGGAYYNLDDLYVADTTGGVNDDFLGPQVVQVLKPMGAGNYAQWSPNFGANYGNVSDAFPDGDQTFNENSTPGNNDSFLFEDVFIASGAISAIQHVIYARQDAGAQRTIAPLQRSSSVDYIGTNFNLAGSYVYYLDVDDVNPDTGAAWDVAGLNDAEFGYDLVA